MSFDAGKFAATLTRKSERRSVDSLDVDKAFAVVAELNRYVGRWGVYEAVQVKIARAIVERKVSPVRVAEIIEATIIRLRLPEGHKHRPRNPGAYFVTSVKEELSRNGHAWNEPIDDQ